VSSFSYTDIDLARVRPGSGVEFLRDYLQYAASGGKRLGDGGLTPIPLNNFEADVFDSLTAQGFKLVPQFGASHFRIDMVAAHPRKPGRLVLAIECDGATYHSSYTARDRDRLRQQQLENLGWRFHRIWSTDWFMRKEDEIKRAVQALGTAVDYADKLDAGAVWNHEARSEEAGTDGREESVRRRGPRPPIPVRPSITDYSEHEITQWIQWVSSDGQLRTDDEIVAEMVSVLGFSRRGARIEAAIRNALQMYRAATKP
jgi:very-short-patch-repair endonuclease